MYQRGMPWCAALRGHDDADVDADADGGDGDVEVIAHSHSMTMPGVPGGAAAAAAGVRPDNPTDGSHQSLTSPYRVVNDTDVLPDTSLLQSLNPPQHEHGMTRGAAALGQPGMGYDFLDSIGPLPDHAPVPMDYLDTAAMISVPQVCAACCVLREDLDRTVVMGRACVVCAGHAWPTCIWGGSCCCV